MLVSAIKFVLCAIVPLLLMITVLISQSDSLMTIAMSYIGVVGLYIMLDILVLKDLKHSVR